MGGDPDHQGLLTLGANQKRAVDKLSSCLFVVYDFDGKWEYPTPKSILLWDLLHADIKTFNKNVISPAESEQACKIHKVSLDVHSFRRHNSCDRKNQLTSSGWAVG